YNPYYEAPPVQSSVVYDYSQPVPVYVEAQPVVVESPPTTVVVQQEVPVASPTLPDAPAPQAPSQPAAEPAIDPKVKEAGAHFDRARDAFKNEKYPDALAAVDQAIQVLPNDAALHEFRALTLFAMKKYKDAAATIYSVLAVGPGWTWDTIRSLYAKQATY